MTDGHDYLGPDGILKGERSRKLLRQAQQRKLLRYDRFRITIAIVLLIVCISAAYITYLSGSQRKEVKDLSSRASTTFQLTIVLSAIAKECTASIYYTSLPGTPTREEVAGIKEIQVDTFRKIAGAGEENPDCPFCGLISASIHLEALLFTQTQVLRRVFTPLEVFLAYKNHMIEIYEVGNLFLGSAMTSGAASILWENELIRAVSTLAAFLRGIGPKYTTPELVERIPGIYNSVAAGLWKMKILATTSFMLIERGLEEWHTSFLDATNGTCRAAQSLLDQVTVDLTGVSVKSTTFTPEAAVQELVHIFDLLIHQFDEEDVLRVTDLVISLSTEICSIFALGLICSVFLLLLTAMLRAILFKAEFFAEKFAKERLELSIERMQFLVDRIFDLDKDGAQFTVDFCSESPSVTPAERTLISLSQRYMSILEFIPTSAVKFRARLLAKQRAQGDPLRLKMGEGMALEVEKERGESYSETEIPLREVFQSSGGRGGKKGGEGGNGARGSMVGMGTGDKTNPLGETSYTARMGTRTSLSRQSFSSSEVSNMTDSADFPVSQYPNELGYGDEGQMRKKKGKNKNEKESFSGRRGGNRLEQGLGPNHRKNSLSTPLAMGNFSFASSFGGEKIGFSSESSGYGKVDYESDFLPPGLVSCQLSTYVIFIIVNISCFCNQLDPSHLKFLLLKIPEFIRVFLNLISSFGGEYIGTSGSYVIGGFRKEDVGDSCVELLLAMHQHLTPAFPNIRCALCGRSVPQHIVGTSSLKVFITDHSVLMIADLLFRVASLYDAVVVIDSFTAVRVDTQMFDKIALERVGLEEDNLHNVMTVYELGLRGEQHGTVLWNEAFDKFQSGMYLEAEEKLLEWRRDHERSERADRFLSNLHDRQTVTFLFASEEKYDCSFVFEW